MCSFPHGLFTNIFLYNTFSIVCRCMIISQIVLIFALSLAHTVALIFTAFFTFSKIYVHIIHVYICMYEAHFSNFVGFLFVNEFGVWERTNYAQIDFFTFFKKTNIYVALQFCTVKRTKAETKTTTKECASFFFVHIQNQHLNHLNHLNDRISCIWITCLLACLLAIRLIAVQWLL